MSRYVTISYFGFLWSTYLDDMFFADLIPLFVFDQYLSRGANIFDSQLTYSHMVSYIVYLTTQLKPVLSRANIFILTYCSLLVQILRLIKRRLGAITVVSPNKISFAFNVSCYPY